MGAFTFKNTSTIDYSLFSTEPLKFIADFDIKELDALYSDGHNLLNTTLKFRNLVIGKPLQTKETPNQQGKWQPNKKYEFSFNLDVKTDEIWLNLQQTHEDNPNVNKEIMSGFCSKIGNIFLEPKQKSFENKHFAAVSNNIKRWFGRHCQSARRKYHIARKINQCYPSTKNHRKLKEASQSYKQKMNFHINKFNRNI